MWKWDRFLPAVVLGTVTFVLPIARAIALDPPEIAARAEKFVVRIDGGKIYSNQPMVDDEAAPASRYTNVRWAFTDSILPQSLHRASYEIQVK